MTELIGAAAACGMVILGCWPAPAPRVQTGAPASRVEVGRRQVARIAILLLALVVGSPAIAVEGLLLSMIGGRLFDIDAQRRAAATLELSVVEVIDRAVVGLRGGLSLDRSFLDAIDRSDLPGTHVLRRCGAGVRSGRQLVDALDALDAPELDSLLRSLIVSVRLLSVSGGPAGRVLERTAATLRSRVAFQAESRTQAQQAWASAVVLSVLPFLFGGVAAALDPDLADFYLTSLPGLACMVGATGLAWAGWEWIDRIVWQTL